MTTKNRHRDRSGCSQITFDVDSHGLLTRIITIGTPIIGAIPNAKTEFALRYAKYRLVIARTEILRFVLRLAKFINLRQVVFQCVLFPVSCFGWACYNPGINKGD